MKAVSKVVGVYSVIEYSALNCGKEFALVCLPIQLSKDSSILISSLITICSD
jgi:hypothetical protein